MGQKTGKTETRPETIDIVPASDDSCLGQGRGPRNGEKWLDSEYILKVVPQDLLMDWMRDMRETGESDLSYQWKVSENSP